MSMVDNKNKYNNKNYNNYNNYTNNKNYNNYTNNNYNNNNNSNNIQPDLTIITELQDYMLTSKNISTFNKNIFTQVRDTNVQNQKHVNKLIIKDKDKEVPCKKVNNNIYKPHHHDSLFWCFYILKYGFSKYEMEVGNQYFTIEKTEKFKYIETLRKNKDILKINKIKPFTDLEDDLANKTRISIKTFFALCIIENLNILLVDKRKIYESINNDNPEIHVIHRNGVTYEHHIELNIAANDLSTIQNTYYKMSGFETNLKSMTSYKVDELLELCKKLDINVTNTNATTNDTTNKKKLNKKDIYELLIQNF